MGGIGTMIRTRGAEARQGRLRDGDAAGRGPIGQVGEQRVGMGRPDAQTPEGARARAATRRPTRAGVRRWRVSRSQP